MKYCGNCGEEIKVIGSKFCSGCGEALKSLPPHNTESPSTPEQLGLAQPTLGQTTPDQPTLGQPQPGTYYTPDQPMVATYPTDPAPKKNISKKILIPILIAAPLLIIILVAVALVASGMFTSPVDRFRSLQQDQIFNPMIQILEAEQETELSTDLIISASAQIHSQDPFSRMATNLLEDLTIELNFNATLDPLEYLIGFNASFLGEEMFQGVITMDDEYFGFYFPDFISDYYIISFEALEDMGEPSAGAGTGFDAYYMGVFATPILTPQDMAHMVARFSDILLSHVHEDNLEVERQEVLLFDGAEEFNAQVYTFNPSQSDIRQILTDIHDELSNEDIYYQIFSSVFNPQDLRWSGYDTTAQYWDSILDDFRREIPELERTLGGDDGFIWRTATYRNQIILQELSFEGDYFFRYERLEERSGERRDWFIIAEPDGNELIILANEMTIRSSETQGRAELSVGMGRRKSNLETMFTLDYAFDPSTTSILDIPYGSYELSFDDGFDEFTVSLLVEAGEDGGTNHFLSIYDIDAFDLESLTINIHSTDEPSEIQAPTRTPVNLSHMSEFELMLLMMDLMMEFESLFEFFDF